MPYTSNIQTIGSVVIALALFQTATLIIGGHIAKELLAAFYALFPNWWQRMLIVIVPLSGIGNIFAAYAFQNPVVAGVSFLVLGLWAPLLSAISIQGGRIDLVSLSLLGAITALGIILGMRLS